MFFKKKEEAKVDPLPLISPLIRCRDDVADAHIRYINEALKQLKMNNKIKFNMKPNDIEIETETIYNEGKKYRVETRIWDGFINDEKMNIYKYRKEGAWLDAHTTLSRGFDESDILTVLKIYDGKLSKKAKEFLYLHDATSFSYNTQYCSICKEKTLHICYWVLILPDRMTLGSSGNRCECLHCLHQILKRQSKRKK